MPYRPHRVGPISKLVATFLDTKSDIWTIVAGVAAVLSAIYAGRSNFIAKKALRISLKEFQNKLANFELYLINANRLTQKDGQKKKILMFNLTVRNKSETSTSYHATLEVEYVSPDHSVSRILLDHNATLKNELPQEGIVVFPKDIRLEGKGLSSGWLLFQQPTEVFQNNRIERYKVIVTDTDNNNSSITTSFVKEFVE